MIYSSTILETIYGKFKVNYHDFNEGECLSLTMGEDQFSEHEKVFVRMHSSCLFSQSFHSLDCDCSRQLDAALEKIGGIGTGVVIYLEQEGRGIGLKNKIKSMEYERVNKVDTSIAFKEIGYDSLDYRDYTVAALALKELRCLKIGLASNDPLKISSLEKCGILIDSREILKYETNDKIEKYLEVKKNKLGHIL